MHDLIIKPNSNDIITITIAEQQALIDSNEIEDTIGIEEGLQELFKSKYLGTVQVRFHVRYTNPFFVVVFAYTSNKNWWAE